MEMRTWATRFVVEPSPTSPIREWLQDKLEQCGFDGSLTSRCVLSIIDRNQCSSPGYRIGLCPTEPVFDCDMDGRSLNSIAVHSSSSGRRPNCFVDGCVDYGQVTEVMEVLRLMLSPEVC
jgi:pentatricopeptide repeat protein